MRAIGVLRAAVSADPDVDANLIRNLAAARKYELVGILTIRPNEYLPTALTVQTVAEHRADAVLAPTMAHFGGAERAVALACDVVTPHETVRRSGDASR